MRIAHVATRLNVGGSAVQVITLAAGLQRNGHETVLLRGREAPDEGNMDTLAAEQGLSPVLIPAMAREVAVEDLSALRDLAARLRRLRPDVVHTHTAKAGALGRVAARLAGGPAVLHTFHGHSLDGYFSPRREAVFRRIEQGLARVTDRIVVPSQEVKADLVAEGVSSPDHIAVVPYGFDFTKFLADDVERARRGVALREELGVPAGATVVTLVARLVPIKRVDRFLRIAARVAERVPDAVFVIAGDGESRADLMASAEARSLADRLYWPGFVTRVPEICFASDVVALTSDNEGTPMSLIEAQAALTPVVGTRVGGAATSVLDGVTGHLVGKDDEQGFADALVALLSDADAARAMGRAGREHVLRMFGVERLVADHEALYRELLTRRRGGTAAA